MLTDENSPAIVTAEFYINFIVLAIFATVMNLAFPSATTDDVIAATDNAFSKLANDVNKQLENIKNSIDQSIDTNENERLRGIHHFY